MKAVLQRFKELQDQKENPLELTRSIIKNNTQPFNVDGEAIVSPPYTSAILSSNRAYTHIQKAESKSSKSTEHEGQVEI